MRRRGFSVLAALTTVLVFCSGLFSAQTANAASAHDLTYRTTDYLQVYSSSHCTTSIDVTDDWSNFILDSSKWAPWDTTNMTSARASFLVALEYGRWGVSVFNGGSSKIVNVFWTEDDSLALEWSGTATDPVWARQISSTTPAHMVNIICGGDMSGNSYNNTPYAYSYDYSLNQHASVSTEHVYTENFFVYTDHPNYPPGYAGDYIREEPPTPVTSPYTGTVNCTGGDPAYMLIYQLGNNGTATLTSVSSGAANWSYNLTSNPYQVTVGCGNKLAASVGTVDPLTSSTDWVCNAHANPPYCVLS